MQIGNPSNSAQVNPCLFTKTLAELAEEKEAKIVKSSATAINFKENGQSIESVQYSHNDGSKSLEATHIILSAGSWTSKLFPRAHLRTPRGHSVVVRPSGDLSPYVLFPSIEAPPNGSLKHVLSPEIYPRPRDRLYDLDTLYASGPDDYDVPLPDTTDHVAVEQGSCNDVWIVIQGVSQEIHDGEIFAKQACYKPQIRPHNEDEEVGSMVGRTGVEGLWLATGYDEWGI